MSDSLEQEIRTLRSLFWSERDPDGRAFAPLADAYLRSGETREALDLLTDGMSRHPEFATGHVVATKLYLEEGMHSEAEFAARRVLELDDENVVAMASLVQVLEEAGEADELERVRATLVRLDPEPDEAQAALPEAPALDATAVDDALPEDFDLSSDGFEAVAEPDGSGDFALAEPAAGIGDTSSEAVQTMKFDFTPPDDDVELSAPAEAVEEVMDLGALAPDPEPEAVEEVMDLGALAPDPEPEAVEEVMDLGALAPDPEPEAVEEVMDLGALAPDPEPEVVEEVMDLGALAPDPEPEVVEASEPLWTRTLAELYVKQGFIGQALDVFRRLLEEDPGAEDIVRRIAELEAEPVEPAAASGMDDAPEEEVETLARDLAESGSGEHDVDTPFAWTEEEADEAHTSAGEGPSIGEYFDGLLSWQPRDGS